MKIHQGKMEMSVREQKLNYEYRLIHRPAFDITGYTKIVFSGGELYREVRADGRWEKLRNMSKEGGVIYGVASFDKSCSPGTYRYTLGIKGRGNEEGMFPFHVNESDWISFTINYSTSYGLFWVEDPYKMIQKIGYDFNKALSIHIDVFDEDYNEGNMEFWMPVTRRIQ